MKLPNINIDLSKVKMLKQFSHMLEFY